MTTTAESKYRGTREYHIVYSELLRAAYYRGIVTYQQVADIMGLPSRGNYMGTEAGHLLGEISEDEHSEGRPMLSALAINKNGTPGVGFFTLAQQLGKLASGATKSDQLAFWQNEKEEVYGVWAEAFTRKRKTPSK